MGISKTLTENLKRILKLKGMTYKVLAEELGISEISLKKSFASASFSLKRVEEISNLLKIDVSDLIQSKRITELNATLSLSQDEILASDEKLLCFFYALFGNSLTKIKSNFRFSDNEIESFLLKLDKADLIDLFPNRKFKMLIRNDFLWPKDGDLNRLYTNKIRDDFFQFDDESRDVFEIFMSGLVTESTKNVMEKKLLKLKEEFEELRELDQKYDKENCKNLTFYGAQREWNLPMEKKYRKDLSEG